ncbi:MAG TPA: hypothetical protein VN253_09015, partial [Kofleriaceae bacterium]|nr:hypothetical protein [Kofleriaceae bacterium]
MIAPISQRRRRRIRRARCTLASRNARETDGSETCHSSTLRTASPSAAPAHVSSSRRPRRCQSWLACSSS